MHSSSNFFKREVPIWNLFWNMFTRPMYQWVRLTDRGSPSASLNFNGALRSTNRKSWVPLWVQIRVRVRDGSCCRLRPCFRIAIAGVPTMPIRASRQFYFWHRRISLSFASSIQSTRASCSADGSAYIFFGLSFILYISFFTQGSGIMCIRP